MTSRPSTRYRNPSMPSDGKKLAQNTTKDKTTSELVADEGENMAQPASACSDSTELANAQLEKALITTIRGEISALKSELVSELRASISEVKSVIATHTTQIADIETSLTDADKRLLVLEHKCSQLEASNSSLRLKLDDLENRGRRKNLRVIGIPEDSEKGRPSEFMSTFFEAVFGAGKLSRAPVIERAHRSLAPKPQPNQRPRPMIVRFHHFPIKEEILRHSRSQTQLRYKGSPIRIYPDLSADLARQRGEFGGVKTQLFKAGVKFRHLYPNRLIINFQGAQREFASPAEANRFFNERIQPTMDPDGAARTGDV